MKRIYAWCLSRSKRTRDSFIFTMMTINIISVVCTIMGASIGSFPNLKIWGRCLIVVIVFAVIFLAIYYGLGTLFKNSVELQIGQTPVSITCGDIFEISEKSGRRVIGCDTHFDTRVDDIVISKNSLHGQLVLQHGCKSEIEALIEREAQRLKLKKNQDGLYDFPLGTVIRYESSNDGKIYLMLAMTELNEQHESHTNMEKFEFMLMKMWKEISRVYARHEIILPVLGTGISRFDDGPKNRDDLVRCMLCTLNISGICLKSKVKIVIHGNEKEIPLYEYRDILHTMSGK